MIHLLQNTLAFIILMPYLLQYVWVKTTMDKATADQIVGLKFTALAKGLLHKYMPIIQEPSDFDLFYPQALNTMKIFNLLWNFKIQSNQPDEVTLHVAHCPVMDILTLFRLTNLKPYVCQGDWEFANDNAHVWQFDRKHEIGKGDSFCDHTYKRLPIKSLNKDNIQTLKPQEIEL